MSRREKLIVEHLALVRRRAAALHRKLGGELEEFEGDGMLGLIKAAERFKPSLGKPFVAFATRHIDGAIRDGYRKLDTQGRHERRQRKKDPDRAAKTGHLVHSERVDLNNPDDWDALMAVAGDQVEELEKKYWRELIDMLPTRLGIVMRMYYLEGQTDAQVGKALGGVKNSWVCRMRLQAIQLIRDYLREKGLLDGS